jgi:hypothetical protein
MACKREVRLIGTWYAVLYGYQSELIQRNDEALRKVTAYHDARLAKAAAELAGSRGAR